MSFIPKRYFYDRVALVLLTALLFVGFVAIVSIILRITTGGQVATDYFVQYRSPAGISAFSTGGVEGILTFIGFVILTLVISSVLSFRTYTIKRELSLTVLSFGITLCVIATIVSNALLALR